MLMKTIEIRHYDIKSKVEGLENVMVSLVSPIWIAILEAGDILFLYANNKIIIV